MIFRPWWTCHGRLPGNASWRAGPTSCLTISGTRPRTKGRPYFVAAADAIIDLADALAPDNAAWRTRKRELQTKLASRRQAAKDGVLVNAKSQPSYRGDGAQLVAIRLSNARERSGLPPGTAGLIVRGSGSGGAATAATRSVEIKGDGFEHSRIVLPLAGRQKGDSIAEVHFRGNTFQSDVTASDSAKGVAATGLKSPPGASITISDAMDARRAVCFILDCSASMNDPAEGEIARTESDSTSATKFDVARWALYEMLRRLVPQNAEVGLVLYGHRMAVGGEENRLLLQKRYFKRFPFPTVGTTVRRCRCRTSDRPVRHGATRAGATALQRDCALGTNAALPGHLEGDRRRGRHDVVPRRPCGIQERGRDFRRPKLPIQSDGGCHYRIGRGGPKSDRPWRTVARDRVRIARR